MDYFKQESERLNYRSLTKEDIPTWIEFFMDNDRLKYLGIDIHKTKEAHAEDWVNMQMSRYKDTGFGHLAVELKSTGEFIGMGGILTRELEGEAEYEISYSLIPKYWGKGYATEIAKQMKAFGQAHIDSKQLISIIEISNEDSANVAQKNGMEILYKTTFRGIDVNIYGISNKLYKK